MPNLHALAVRWDALFNGLAVRDPVIGYLLVSAGRILVLYAVALFLVALTRYVRLAFPQPHTASNAVYWLRWWLWLRLREFSLLKVSAAALALLLVLQVPAGVAGASSAATWSRVLVLAAQVGVFIGLAQFLHHLTRRILHPAD